MIRAASVLTFLSLLAANVPAQCPAGIWTTLAPLNEPRQELTTAELDGKVYAVAGLGGRGNANEIYDIASNAWTFGADLPVATDHAWAVALDGRVYVGAGISNRVFSYDPATDNWADVAPSEFPHGGTAAAAVIDGRIY